jgi:hypothetical protein
MLIERRLRPSAAPPGGATRPAPVRFCGGCRQTKLVQDGQQAQTMEVNMKAQIGLHAQIQIGRRLLEHLAKMGQRLERFGAQVVPHDLNAVAVGGKRPVHNCIRVDLPAQWGPSKVTRYSGTKCRLNSSKTLFSLDQGMSLQG